MFNQFFEQILILKELEKREEAALVPRTGSRMAFWVAVRVAGYVVGLPSITSRMNYWLRKYPLAHGFPWLYCLILGVYAAWDPGRTPHWQAACDTTEFCRISTTCPDLDNVFFQKPRLSFKQSIILPAYQFPQDCEEGKEKKNQNHDDFSSSISIWGLAVGTSELFYSLQVH